MKPSVKRSSPTHFFEALRDAFAAAAHPENAGYMAAYMQNNFEFLGIKAVPRRIIQRSVIETYGLPSDSEEFAELCWQQSAREFQLTAMDILERDKHYRQEGILDFYEKLITHKSWWDTVDMLASHLVGGHVLKHPSSKDCVRRWINAEDMWLNRAAIIFQIKFKSDTDVAFLRDAILPHVERKEFFIQKAIGWALRQYADTNREWVIDFAEHNPLKPLSRREALRKL